MTLAATPPRLRPAVLGWSAAGLLTIGGLGVWNPNQSHVPLCPFKAMTGLDCPLCGGLRATWDVLHGHPGQAASQNLLLVAGTVVAVIGGLVALLVPNARGVLLRNRQTSLRTALIVAAAFWLLRDLPISALQGLTTNG